MKIAILTLGTRGDVQPYAVLGQALQRCGHVVTLCTGKNFESLVKSYGIGFVAVEADYQAMLDSDEGKKIMKGNLLTIRHSLKTWVYPWSRSRWRNFTSWLRTAIGCCSTSRRSPITSPTNFPEK